MELTNFNLEANLSVSYSETVLPTKKSKYTKIGDYNNYDIALP